MSSIDTMLRGLVGFVLLVFLHLASTEASISVQDAVASFSIVCNPLTGVERLVDEQAIPGFTNDTGFSQPLSSTLGFLNHSAQCQPASEIDALIGNGFDGTTAVSLVIAFVGMGLLMTNTHFSRPVCAVVSLGFWLAVLWIGVMVSLEVGVGLSLVAVWTRRTLMLFPGELKNEDSIDVFLQNVVDNVAVSEEEQTGIKQWIGRCLTVGALRAACANKNKMDSFPVKDPDVLGFVEGNLLPAEAPRRKRKASSANENAKLARPAPFGKGASEVARDSALANKIDRLWSLGNIHNHKEFVMCAALFSDDLTVEERRFLCGEGFSCCFENFSQVFKLAEECGELGKNSVLDQLQVISPERRK
eukprot:m.427136 g.427136  ORF g.427136 m.427136 type:complete len:360 (-) comp16864_c3_seq9:8786-9865(-)